MRVETEAAASTGMLPPPRVRSGDPRHVDWQAALPGAALVAIVGAVLTVVGLKLSGVALLSIVWVLSGATIALTLYARKNPRAWMSARVGVRVGLVTGLMLCGAMGVAGAATGVILRFGTHSLAGFDQQSAEQAKAVQAWAVNWLAQQGQSKEVQENYVRMLNSPMMTSPEAKAGSELASLGFQGVLILLISAGGGAFAGMVQGRRGRVAHRD